MHIEAAATHLRADCTSARCNQTRRSGRCYQQGRWRPRPCARRRECKLWVQWGDMQLCACIAVKDATCLCVRVSLFIHSAAGSRDCLLEAGNGQRQSTAKLADRTVGQLALVAVPGGRSRAVACAVVAAAAAVLAAAGGEGLGAHVTSVVDRGLAVALRVGEFAGENVRCCSRGRSAWLDLTQPPCPSP